MNEYEELKKAGCKDIDNYMLVNNYGYKFLYKDIKYNCRHWLNCYGADVDFWTLENRTAELLYSFSTFEKMIDFIKSI